MNISPVVAPNNSVSAENPQAGASQSIRTLRMNTQTTPHYGPPPEASEQQAVHTSMSNPEATEGTEERQPLSPQYAALAKQKRALQVKERELAEREKAMSSQSGQTNAIDLARLKSEPLKVLEEAGITYQELADHIMANPINPDVYALKNEIKNLKENLDNKFTERDQQAEKQVLSEMRKEAQQLANLDDFEMVRGTGAVPKVMQLIERTYRESGEVLDVREAMQLVEEELFKDAQKMASFKKLQSHLMPQTQQPVQRTTGMRTLTNRDTSMQSPMSAKQRALAAFYGTLQK